MDKYEESEESREIVDLIVKNNAINIFNIFYTLDIDLFIISGGVTKSEWFVEMIKNKVQDFSNEKGSGAIINIKVSEAKQNSGILGALKFIKTNI
ncbi:hypothetical protein C4B24_05070 [Mycoplasma marinum]|uniref:ROK family protein n=2 Tax=Mycoplasma marinum TaxID=1937190 RepID=A0A4R0XRS4_9MOLU|nr:hypothetical protein C4B24_05070 [Mycoplasma marinum]